MVILGESAERVKRAADQAGVAYLDATDVADATQKPLNSLMQAILSCLVQPMPAGTCMRILKCGAMNSLKQ